MSVPGLNNNNKGFGISTNAAITPSMRVIGHKNNNDGRYSRVANSASALYTAAHARQYNNSTFVANNSNNDKANRLIAEAN